MVEGALGLRGGFFPAEVAEGGSGIGVGLFPTDVAEGSSGYGGGDSVSKACMLALTLSRLATELAEGA